MSVENPMENLSEQNESIEQELEVSSEELKKKELMEKIERKRKKRQKKIKKKKIIAALEQKKVTDPSNIGKIHTKLETENQPALNEPRYGKSLDRKTRVGSRRVRHIS